MKICLWGARAGNLGLGIQTQEFYEQMKPNRTLVVDISHLDGKGHYPDRYQNADFDKGFLSEEFIDEYLEKNKNDIDVIFCVEIPYSSNYYLFKKARELKIKTILQYNYEFLDYLNKPDLPYPDLLLAPSKWNIREAEQKIGNKCPIKFLPFPVNREKLPFKLRTKIKTFIHISGHKLLKDRNGTFTLLDAIPYVKSKDIKFKIYSQHDLLGSVLGYTDKNIEFYREVPEYRDLYRTGDVLILPRKFGGLSLQLNEAMSCGMIPIMTNIEPQSDFLHRYCLIKPIKSEKIYTRTEINYYDIEPIDLALKIDKFAKMETEQVKNLSEYSNKYAEKIDWSRMKNEYLKVFEEIL